MGDVWVDWSNGWPLGVSANSKGGNSIKIWPVPGWQCAKLRDYCISKTYFKPIKNLITYNIILLYTATKAYLPLCSSYQTCYAGFGIRSWLCQNPPMPPDPDRGQNTAPTNPNHRTTDSPTPQGRLLPVPVPPADPLYPRPPAPASGEGSKKGSKITCRTWYTDDYVCKRPQNPTYRP